LVLENGHFKNVQNRKAGESLEKYVAKMGSYHNALKIKKIIICL
jgi:hypothetical protein